MTEPVIVTKRLHIGGLTPNITTAHLRDRFKIFGQIDEVEELKPDALGQARPFAYLTMQITPPQLKRCMNILSGSMYRGAQLRIAEAKPRYTVKIQQENHPSAEQKEKEKVKKRKRARREMGPEVGKEAQDMSVVNEENHKRSKFWKITPDGHLIRPIAVRPAHTLQPPITAHIPTDADKSTSTSKPKRNPPSRQRRRVIDPTLWNPEHLSEAALCGPEGVSREDGEWVFEEISSNDLEDAAGSDAADDDDEERVTLGVWRKVGGENEGEEEIVRVKRTGMALDTEPEESEEDLELDLNWGPSGGPREASPLFGDRGEDGMGSPLFGHERDQDGQQSVEAGAESQAASARSVSPLFASRETRQPITGADDGSDEQTDIEELPKNDILAEEGTPGQSSRSSPLFAARQFSPLESAQQQPTVKPSPSAKPSHTPSLTVRPSIPKELLNQAKSETSLGLSVISSLLSETPDAQHIPAKPARNEWAGFDESDSDEEDIFQGRNVASEGVLRLRGGAPEHQVLRLRGGAPEGVDEDVDMDGDSDSDSDSNSDSGSEVSSTSSASSTSSGSSTSSASSSSTSSPSSSSSSSSSSSPSSSSSSISSGPSSSTTPTSGRAAAPSKSSLKSLFNPTNATAASFSLSSAPTAGFSLSAIAGDLDLTEELDIPLAPHLASSSKPELELLTAMTPRQVFDPSPDIPLFFAPADPTRVEVSRAGWAKHPITAEKEEKGDEYRGFWRIKTDEEMKERWDRVRGELTQEWKRRGREARKQRKRRGGGEGDD